jgi:hypothetical protein
VVRGINTRLCGAALYADDNRLQLDLSDCADVSFVASISSGSEQLRDGRARVCPLPRRPIVTLQQSGWQLAGQLNDGAARIVTGELSVANGAARLDLSGDAAAIRSGTIAIERVSLSDQQTPPRFNPMFVNGALRLIRDQWTGDLGLAIGQRRLGTVAVKHQMETGTGEAVIDIDNLAFDSDMFQPADIAPFLGAFGSRIRGSAEFSGRFAWSKDGTTSEGRLVIPGIDLQSPLGAVRQLKTDVSFTSLLPLTIRPNQVVTIDRVDVLVPLEQVSATFTYMPDALRLESATAIVAGGRATLDPMMYNLTPGAISTGTLRLQNLSMQQLIDVAGLTDRMMVQARIDGAVPFTLGPDGVRFANGRIAANAPGRLSISRDALTSAVGTGADAQAPPNAVQDFAYQALEHLAFDRLEGVVNSQPMGRLGVQLHIVGSNDPPQTEETRVGVFDLLRGRAFDRPLPLPKGTPIDLTLDTSVNLDELLESYLNRRGGAGAAAMSSTGP